MGTLVWLGSVPTAPAWRAALVAGLERAGAGEEVVAGALYRPGGPFADPAGVQGATVGLRHALSRGAHAGVLVTAGAPCAGLAEARVVAALAERLGAGEVVVGAPLGDVGGALLAGRVAELSAAGVSVARRAAFSPAPAFAAVLAARGKPVETLAAAALLGEAAPGGVPDGLDALLGAGASGAARRVADAAGATHLAIAGVLAAHGLVDVAVDRVAVPLGAAAAAGSRRAVVWVLEEPAGAGAHAASAALVEELAGQNDGLVEPVWAPPGESPAAVAASIAGRLEGGGRQAPATVAGAPTAAQLEVMARLSARLRSPVVSAGPGAGAGAGGGSGGAGGPHLVLRVPAGGPRTQGILGPARGAQRARAEQAGGAGHPRAELASASVVVCAGRGAAGALGLVERLADLLGGAPAATSGAVAAGAPARWLVGRSGARVAPAAYLAFGVSGAGHHLAGTAGAGLVVAVERDPSAPILSVANLGVLGDAPSILARLVATLEG